jgi:hypothetical protein
VIDMTVENGVLKSKHSADKCCAEQIERYVTE